MCDLTTNLADEIFKKLPGPFANASDVNKENAFQPVPPEFEGPFAYPLPFDHLHHLSRC